MPTFSLVPKSGCTPLGYSLDHIGPLARSTWDCAAMLGVLAGYDASDPCSTERPIPDYVAALDGSVAGMRIGVVREDHLVDGTAPEVISGFEAAVGVLSDLGAIVEEVALPYYREVVAASLVTMVSEACAYHRNDLVTRWGDYFRETRHIVSWGALVSGADYVQAQRVRRVGQQALAELFGRCEVIITPTCTTGAPTYEELEHDGILGLMATVHTTYWDGVGNPALVVPMGFDAGGLPLSMQIAGRPFDEPSVLRVGDAYQQATDWHLRVPSWAADAAPVS
jgi:aspartyl-tRNA(Asn)/glutamyl-tRNA(Gln) amidotransferase subunit A